MELIFILTYNCNYRCRYCDIDKRDENMTPEILDASLLFIKRLPYRLNKVKFFWWEPTLYFDLIKNSITSFPQGEASFYMTTNGSLITPQSIMDIKELWIISTISLDGPPEVTGRDRLLVSGEGSMSLIPRILQIIWEDISLFRVNQVITPKTVRGMRKNFEYLYTQGFRSFNFLPEYYVEWSKSALTDLMKWFQEISDMRSTHPIYLVNQENYSLTSFFNLGMVIDTDGSVYGTNLILAGRFEKYKNELRLGNIFDKEFLFPEWNDQEIYIQKVDSFLKKEYSDNILKSVYYINRLLSNFTLSYGK